MGIKNFSKVIEKYSPGALEYKKIDQYRNKTFGIDTNLMVYKIIFGLRKGGYDLKNDDIVVTHIQTMLQKLLGFNKYNIKPVFVFDGEQPKMKDETLKERKEVRKEHKRRYDEAITQDEQKKYFYLKSDIKRGEMEDIRKLIKIFGYQIVDSLGEADSQLAYLSKNKLVDYIVTDDMDILLFGGDKVLKNFTVNSSKKMTEIDLNKLKKKTGLSQDQIIDIGILLGCDYCPSVKGVGPVTAYKLIKEKGNIENLKDENIKIDNYKEIKEYFKNPQVIKIKKLDKVRDVNYDELVKFMVSKKYDEQKISKIIEKIINKTT